MSREVDQVREALRIYDADLKYLLIVGRMVYDRVVGAFSYICHKKAGADFTGFMDPGALATCDPESEEFQ